MQPGLDTVGVKAVEVMFILLILSTHNRLIHIDVKVNRRQNETQKISLQVLSRKIDVVFRLDAICFAFYMDKLDVLCSLASLAPFAVESMKMAMVMIRSNPYMKW